MFPFTAAKDANKRYNTGYTIKLSSNNKYILKGAMD